MLWPDRKEANFTHDSTVRIIRILSGPPSYWTVHGQQLNYVLTEDGQSYGRMRSFDLKAQMNSRQEMSESLRIPSCLAISCTTVRSNELRMLEIQMEIGEALTQPDSGTDG